MPRRAEFDRADVTIVSGTMLAVLATAVMNRMEGALCLWHYLGGIAHSAPWTITSCLRESC